MEPAIKESRIYILRPIVKSEVFGTQFIINAFENLIDFLLLNKLPIPVTRRKRLVKKLQELAGKWSKNLK